VPEKSVLNNSDKILDSDLKRGIQLYALKATKSPHITRIFYLQ